MLLISKSDKSDDGDGPTVDVASFWDSNDVEATNNADVQVAVFEDTGYVANFTLPTLKIFLEARSQNVYCNQQQLVARAIGCSKTHFVPTNSRSSGQPSQF